MKPANLLIPDTCFDCGLKGKGSFCRLPVEEKQTFNLIAITKIVPKGAYLFFEGEPATVVFMLCKGRAKLSVCAPNGKTMIICIAEPGDILGLSAALTETTYETTAEMLELSQVKCLKVQDLLSFFEKNPTACLNAARQLSQTHQATCRQVRALGLSDSVADKLAELFLTWSGNGTGGDGRIHLKNFFTHEEIAEMIGTSRETVTRALKYFREQELVTLKGSDLFIHDRKRLKAFIGTRPAIRPYVS